MPTRRSILPVALLLAAGVLPALSALPARPAQAARTSEVFQPAGTPVTKTVDFGTSRQPIDGFGFASAFQRADLMHGARGLSPQKQREVLDLLLSRDKRAKLSILRLGIGSSADEVYDHMKSIQPVDPVARTPRRATWDGDDGG